MIWRGPGFSPKWAATQDGYFQATIQHIEHGKYFGIALERNKGVVVRVCLIRTPRLSSVKQGRSYPDQPRIIELNNSDWQTVLPDPKIGDRIYYVSEHEFRVKDLSGQDVWSGTRGKRKGFQYRAQDVAGPLCFSRMDQNTTVYVWIYRRDNLPAKNSN